jgi:signal transduction histidine kinase
MTPERDPEEAAARLLQMEKLAAIGRLVAGFTHEVRNPLTVILGQASTLAARARDPKDKEGLRAILQATKRIETLIKSLLSYSRASKLTVGPIDLGSLLDTTLDLVLLEEKWRFADIEKDFDPQAPWTGGNVNTVMQVFLNLIVNALQAMDGRKEAKLRISLRGSQDGKAVVVEVADNGPGIPPEVQARLFEPFFTTKGKQGTGLGLSIVKDIVTSHGGTIGVASAPGQGARFSVTLPAQPRQD